MSERIGVDRLALYRAEQTAFWAGGLQHSRAVLVEGEIKPSIVVAACAGLRRRHAALRQRFDDAGGEPRLVQDDGGPPEVAAGAPRSLVTALTEAAADAGRRFDLRERPGFRVGVYPVEGGRTLVVLTLHAAVGGRSAAACLLRELGRQSAPPRTEPRHGTTAALDARQPIAWPTGRGPGRSRGRSVTAAWSMGANDTALLRRFAADLSVPVASVLRCALRVLLFRETGERDILIGSPRPGHAGEAVVTPEDIQILPYAVSPLIPGADAVRAEHAATTHPIHHPEALDLLLSRASRPERHAGAELQVGFWSDTDTDTDTGAATWAGRAACAVDLPTGHSPYELEVEVAPRGDLIAGAWRGAAGLFDEQTLERMGRSYTTLIRELVGDPAAPIGDLDVIHPDDRARLAAWEAPTPSVSGDRTVVDLVGEWIGRTPGEPAVILGDAVRTYRELDDAASRIAAALRALELPPAAPIGILVARRVELPAILLGVARAGRAAVPMDPSHPVERLAHIVGDSGCGAVIGDGALPDDRVSALGAPVIPLSSLLAADPEPHAGRPHPDSLAYVLYTSGSTGRPKGVGVTHRGLANCLVATRDLLDFRPGRSLLAVTTISFDIAMLELYLALISGGRTILATTAQARSGTQLQAVLARHKPDVMQATPMTWHILFATGWPGDPGLVVSCGGDVVSPELASRLTACTKEFWHTYGPTEASMYAVCERLPREPQTSVVPVGRPLPGVWLRIRDAAGRPVPPGVIGELHIGGAGVARGYVGAPGASAERFVPDPTGAGGRLYRTGDLARWRADGRLELRGRNDRQVKIRGHRIEPDEIESVLGRHPEIAYAAIVVTGPDIGGKRIVAFLQPRQPEPGPDLVPRVAAHARQALPAYMMPSSYALMSAMPLTSTGKVDRAALARIRPPRPNGAAGDPEVPPPRPDPRTAGVRPLRWTGREDRPSLVLLGGDAAWPAPAVAELERWFRVAMLDVSDGRARDVAARLATLDLPGAAVVLAWGDLVAVATEAAHDLREHIGVAPRVLAVEPTGTVGPGRRPQWVVSRDPELLREWPDTDLVLLAQDPGAAMDWSLLAAAVAATG